MVYNMLQDNWDTMNGIYLGKVLTGFLDILDLVGIEDKLSCYSIIRIIDKHREEVLNAKHRNKAASTKKS